MSLPFSTVYQYHEVVTALVSGQHLKLYLCLKPSWLISLSPSSLPELQLLQPVLWIQFLDRRIVTRTLFIVNITIAVDFPFISNISVFTKITVTQTHLSPTASPLLLPTTPRQKPTRMIAPSRVYSALFIARALPPERSRLPQRTDLQWARGSPWAA